MCICACVYIYVRMHVCIYSRIYMLVCMYVCMYVCTVFIEAPRHEDVLREWVVVPHILDIDNRCRRVVSFTSQSLHVQ